MKVLTLSFLVLSLAFAACSDTYERLMDNSAQTRALSNEANGEKFEFGKIYSVYNIPQDAYNHIPKDTLEALLFAARLKSDSVMFKKQGETEKEITTFNEILYSFSGILGSYGGASAEFTLELAVNYSPQGSKNATVRFYSYKSYGALEVKEGDGGFKRIYYSSCYGSPKPHTALPCVEAAVCDFHVMGKIMKRASLTFPPYDTYVPAYTYDFIGTITSAGADYSIVEGEGIKPI